MDVTIYKANESYLKIDADPGILYEIADHFTFEVPGAKFHPKYKARVWDGRIRLFHVHSRLIYAGLREAVIEWAAKRDYTVEDRFETSGHDVTRKDVQVFADGLNLQASGSPIKARDYQLDAVFQAITKGRVLLVSPTASGKSLMLYILMRWHLAHGRKQMLVVPTKNLVEQMYSDFADYSSATKWKVEKHCARAGDGRKPTSDTDILISTWQSLQRQPDSFFEPFTVIYGDEAHQYKAKSLTNILEVASTAAFRIGTTGTLDGLQTHRLVLEGLFGPVYKVTTTKTLMDTEQVATLAIKAIVLEYTDAERKQYSKVAYPEEIEFLTYNVRRNKFIRNLAVVQKRNTLVLFRLVEHGKQLHLLIGEKVHEKRKVFLVYGATESDAREEVREIIESEKDAIIVASKGTFSTGVNIKNLSSIIFASPSKSRIQNLQSIGRGLRKSDSKDHCTLFDIGDDLTWKSKINHTYNHLVERIKIYAEEQFDYKIINIPLGTS